LLGVYAYPSFRPSGGGGLGFMEYIGRALTTPVTTGTYNMVVDLGAQQYLCQEGVIKL